MTRRILGRSETSPQAITRSWVGLGAVKLDDNFWAPRQDIVRSRTLPHQEHHLRTGGQFDALRMTWKPGERHEPHPFWESDVAKWIEAASYSLSITPSPSLEASVDEAIALLAGAQQSDGYLNTYFTLVRPGRRWTDLEDAHELYGAGHLIEAGVAHFAATGKTTLLDVVRKLADLVDRETAAGGAIEGGYDGHEEIELALVRLAGATGEERYLRLSRRLIDNRGQKPFYFEAERNRRGDEGWAEQFFPERPRNRERFREYNQSHLPVKDQSHVVGHSVRAMYLYSAMADLALIDDDQSLRDASEKLWDDLVRHKLYLTGGVGGDGSIEGFGPAYDLPDFGAYAETCASIGLVFWAHRMMMLTGESHYIDVLERALYNGVISGASLDGTEFFYQNPLSSRGGVERQEWFGTACCPPNYARLVESLGQYVYVTGPRDLYVNLHVASDVTFVVDSVAVRVQQMGEMPWGARLRFAVNPEVDDTSFALRIRVPGWAQDDVAVTLAGDELSAERVDGYLVIDREWSRGDTVDVTMSLEPQVIYPHSKIHAVASRVAIQRGPVVYCFEEIDNAAPVERLRLSAQTTFGVEHDDHLQSDVVIADGVVVDEGGELYSPRAPAERNVRLRAIPYFAWANRGLGTMGVWIARH